MEIIGRIAKDQLVEKMVCNIAKTSRLDCDLRDLAQMVYLVLCEYEDEKILELWNNGEIRFFIARIIMNNLNSKSSPYYRIIRKFSDRSVDISTVKDA